jgi:co-chaperonin GroES (HSP10)
MQKFEITPSPGCLVINHMPIADQTSSGLYIPENLVNQPNGGYVIKSGRECQMFRGDTVYYMLGASNVLDQAFSIVPERFCYHLFRTHHLTVKNMCVHNGWVLIEIPYVFSDKTTLGLDAGNVNETMVQNELVVRHGTVVKAPRRAYDAKDPIVSTYFNKDEKVDVKKGDTVFFSKYVISSIMQGAYMAMSLFTSPEGKTYIIVPYKELICKYSSGKVTSLNDYCVVEKKTHDLSGALLYPEGKVSGRFIDRMIPVSGASSGIKEGEKIVLPPGMKPVSLEPERFRTLDKKLFYFKSYYAAFSCDDEQIVFKNSQAI